MPWRLHAYFHSTMNDSFIFIKKKFKFVKNSTLEKYQLTAKNTHFFQKSLAFRFIIAKYSLNWSIRFLSRYHHLRNTSYYVKKKHYYFSGPAWGEFIGFHSQKSLERLEKIAKICEITRKNDDFSVLGHFKVIFRDILVHKCWFSRPSTYIWWWIYQ